MAQNPLSTDLDFILEQTRASWEALRGKRIFITGGTGFFGCWLLESFLWANEKLELGAEAVVLTRNPDAFKKKTPWLATHPAIRLHQGDIQTFSFPDGEFFHVIHAAAETQSPSGNALELVESLVQGTRRVLDFAVVCKAQKFLLTSSGAVYGPQPPDLLQISEDYPGAPDPLQSRSAYGVGKRMAEHLCALYAERSPLEIKIARCFAFVGPYLPLHAQFAIGNFIRDALNGRPILVSGNGTPVRSYLYAADLAVWLWTILFHGAPGRAYNVGSPHEIDIAHLADTVRTALESLSPVQITSPRPVSGLPPRYVPNVERATKELALSAHFELPDAIRRTAQWAAIPSAT